MTKKILLPPKTIYQISLINSDGHLYLDSSPHSTSSLLTYLNTLHGKTSSIRLI